MRLPDFITIGAMKCATSTLHDQLGAQRGLFMSQPKEPYFFSNDEVYERGIGWYGSLFKDARGDALCGESSTHYTKLPTYPHSVERMRQHVPGAKLIYIMRHPIDRLVSQYVHEWTQGVIRASGETIDQALDNHPQLIDYSLYAMQLEPFLDTYGTDQVLPVFFERLHADPQAELERVCRFIGYREKPRWEHDLGANNVSAVRLRKSPVRDLLVELPGLKQVRRGLIPQGVRDWVKSLWQVTKRPVLSQAQADRLRDRFDKDLGKLGGWLGIELSCDTFKQTVSSNAHDWGKAGVEK